MSDLLHHSIAELLSLLRKRECSSEEIVRAVIAAASEDDARVRAYLSVDAGEAIRDARAADARRAAGEDAALLGIPVGIKDIFHVSGWPCACASRILEGYRATYDAEAVARLRRAGAIPLGRLNMDEFAMGSSTENSAFQITRNPWNPDTTPGGSSGGSAAAVAARTAIAALGTDTGGSIRQPASFCGCVGVKPTYGRISRRGMVAFASSLDQAGPLARTVEDAALLLHAMTGHDPMDSTSLDLPPLPPDAAAGISDLKGIRIGLPAEYFAAGLDAEVEARLREAIRCCEQLGAETVEVSMPHTPYAVSCYYLIAPAEASANLARFDGVRYGRRIPGGDPAEMMERTRATGFGEEVKRRILLGTFALSSGYYDAYYLRAQKARTLIRRDFERAFQACDVLLAPVAPTVAFRLGERTNDPLAMYLGDALTIPVNLAGNCALSVPCGFTGGGLPVGLQVIGPAFGEEAILQVAGIYERATDWHRRRPARAGGGRS